MTTLGGRNLDGIRFDRSESKLDPDDSYRSSLTMNSLAGHSANSVMPMQASIVPEMGWQICSPSNAGVSLAPASISSLIASAILKHPSIASSVILFHSGAIDLVESRYSLAKGPISHASSSSLQTSHNVHRLISPEKQVDIGTVGKGRSDVGIKTKAIAHRPAISQLQSSRAMGQRQRVVVQLALCFLTFGALLQAGVLAGDNPCAAGPPVDTNPAECCPTPMLVDGTIMMDCYKKYGEQTKKQLQMDGIPRGCCIAECAMNATNMYADGMLKRDDLSKMFMDAVKDKPEWMSLVRDATNACFELAEKKMDEIEAGAKLEPSFEGEKICHPISGTILRCMGMMMFAQCPASVFNVNENCNKLREPAARPFARSTPEM
uniref:OBP47-like domain-containing protein n=1 Tax=Anopheles melas TaxID=34690 RepID=A0A182UIH1_9DIPT